MHQQLGGHAVFRPKAKVHPLTLLSHSLMWFTVSRRQIKPCGPQYFCKCSFLLTVPVCGARLNLCAWNRHMWPTGFPQCHNSWISHKEAELLLVFHSCHPACLVHLCHCCFYFPSTVWVRAVMNLNENKFFIWSLRDIILTSLLKVKLNRRRDKVHIRKAQNREVRGERGFKITNCCLQIGFSAQSVHKARV